MRIVRLLIFKMSMLQKHIPVDWYKKVTLVVQILIKVPHFPKGYICKTVKTKHSKKAEWRNVECKKKQKNFLLKQEREVKNTACTETCVCTGFRSLPRVKCCTSKQHPPPPITLRPGTVGGTVPDPPATTPCYSFQPLFPCSCF